MLARGEQDDAAARARRVAAGRERLGEQGRAAGVGRPGAVELGGGDLGERSLRRVGVGGDDDVELAAEPLAGPHDERRRPVGVAEVELDVGGAVAPPVDDDLGAVRAQPLGHGGADRVRP